MTDTDKVQKNKSLIKIGKAISGVVFFTLVAKLMGFLREVLLSYYFGATGISDAYLVSQNIPGTIFQFVGTGLTTCFIPIYFKILKEREESDAKQFTNVIITIVLIFSTVIIALIWEFTPIVIKLFASGFSGETLYYATWFTRICILSLYFSSFLYVYTSLLQANGNFNVPAFAWIPNSMCIMLAIVLGAKVNIWLLSIGSVLAVGVQVLVLVPSVHKIDCRYKPCIKWNNIYIKEFIYLMAPVIIGVSVNQINTLVDRTVASQVSIGGISALTYANSLIQLVEGGLVQPIITVFYPQITSFVSEKQHDAAKAIVEKTFVMLLAVLVPITIGFLIFARPITGMLFGRGAFDDSAIKLTSSAVIFYSIGICFVGIRELLSRYYFANSNTKTPMINATIGVAVNIVMNLVLSRFIGIGGLAFATSLSAIVTAILLIRDCKRKLLVGKLHINYGQIIRIAIATAIMSGCSYGAYLIINLNSYLALIIAVLIGVFVYAIVGYLLNIELVNLIFDMLLKIVKRRH